MIIRADDAVEAQVIEDRVRDLLASGGMSALGGAPVQIVHGLEVVLWPIDDTSLGLTTGGARRLLE